MVSPSPVDWCSAAAFLGFTGLTALYGMDGRFLRARAVSCLCAVLLLIAEPLRNAGRYTLGDIIRTRMQSRTSLLAAIAGTVVVNFAPSCRKWRAPVFWSDC